jgi:hypothetical protein
LTSNGPRPARNNLISTEKIKNSLNSTKTGENISMIFHPSVSIGDELDKYSENI